MEIDPMDAVKTDDDDDDNGADEVRDARHAEEMRKEKR